MKKLIAKIRAILRNRRVRKIWTRTVSSIACLVVFITTYALVLPAITMESEAACGIEAHQHDESCYEERLICNIPESDGHKHTADCYSTTQKLICDRSEHLHTSDCYDEEGNLTCSQEEHQHGEECYEEIQELICGLEESEGHHHDSSCYEKVLTCEKEVHTHGPACYREDAASVAATEHSAIATTTTTSADDAAMDETANASGTFDPAETAAEGYVPTLDELDFRQLLNDYTTIYYHRPEGSTEDSGQIRDWQKVTEDTVLGETDILRVYLAYTIPAGSLNETNATARYRLPDNLHLTNEQMDAINETENGLSGLYMDYDMLQITDAEKHSAYLGAEAVDGLRTPDQKMEDSLSGNNEAGDGDQTAQEIISAVVKTDQVYDEDGVYGKKGAYLGTDLVFTFSPYTILKNRNEYDSDGTPVKAGESVSGWFTLDFNMDQVDWKDNAAEITFVSEDIDLNTSLISESLQKADPISEESPDSNNPDDEKAFNENSSTEENKDEAVEETHPAVSFEDSLTVHTGNLSSDTEAGNLPNSSKMTVSVSAEAGTFPAGTAMVLSAVTDMDAVAEAVEGTVDSKTCGFQAVDISFRDKDGNEIEPLKPISVTMRSDSIKAATEDSSMAPVVVHVEDQSKKPADAAGELVTTVMETLPSSVDNNNSEPHGITDSSESISFKADSFSIYAIVYTVDFHWEINGKMYEFSLPGGGFVSFTDLVEVLGITGDSSADENGDKIAEDAEENKSAFAENAEENAANEEAEGSGVNSDSNTPLTLGDIEVSDVAIRFVADVTNVEFSSPELVDISKVNADTTVGQIKESRGLECQYSAELLEEQIAEINAQTVEAGDWALISVQPFTSEERLTVTMKDGSEFTIRVTDAQTDAVHNSEGTVQTVPNPTGTTIDLFNYYVDSDRKKRANRYQWPGVYENDMWKYNWYNFDGSLAESNYDTGWNKGEDWRKQHLIGNGNNLGINKNHIFKFTPANDNAVIDGSLMDGDYHKVNKNGSGGVNSYTGNADPNQGLVQGKLVNGYPALSNNHDEGTETTNPSLAYLFNGDVVEGKDRYDGVNHLLYVDPDGYYTYDSRDFKVDFDTTNKTFTLTDQDTDDTEKRGFWPFGEQVFWSGLHMNTQFSMPTNGQVLNPKGEYKDMQFEFSGDDDTWLYVDGVLVGDGGGIHNRTEIDINFAKGTVTVTGKKGGSHSGTFEETKYLDDIFRNAEKYNEDDWEDIGDGSGHKRFKAETYHTFDMFYLERGGGESNLYIHYNLVSTADFTGHKALNGLEDDERLLRDEFQFELIGLNGRYSSDGTLVDQNANALRPKEGSASGTGKAESPKLEIETTYTYENGTTVPSWTYTTGVTEDGNINFGTIEIPDNPPSDMTYRYVIKEIPKDRTDKLDGVDYDHIDFDTKVYYMQATLDYWYDADDVNHEHGRPYLRKTYYLDDTFQTPIPDKFVSFTNEVHHPSGSVEFTKVDAANSPLAGATFTLYTDETCTKVAKSLDGVEQVITTESDGKVVFDNMAAPKIYYMKETQKPGEEYIQNDKIYEVSVSETGSGKTSVITVYGEENAEPLTSIVNSKEGELSVKKVWLDRNGNPMTGSQDVNVTLKRRKTEVPADLPTNHITFQMHISDPGNWGSEYSNMTVVLEEDVIGYNAAIEWYDCWQDQYLTSLTVTQQDGTPISTDHYTYWSIDENDHSKKLLLYGISEGARVEVEYGSGVAWLWQGDNKTKVQSPSIEAGEVQTEIVEDDDFNYDAIVLSAPDYFRVWKTGGNPSNYVADGYDLPAVDANNRPYYYYVEELELEGYQTTYSNNEGITEGQIRITNQSIAENSINVVIKKTDNAENSTNYLDGAVFKLMYRSDSSGTFTNVSNESVPELDSNSQFIVPKTGITLTGLVDGQYQLQEISPPSGYVIVNSTPVTFTVSGGTITSREGSITDVRYTGATEDNYAEFIIPNPPGAALPSTGGSGTRLFTILGSILILGAGVLLWRREPISN